MSYSDNYLSEDISEPMSYDTMIEGYEDEATELTARVIDVSSTNHIFRSQISYHNLYEYLVSTCQTCFVISYDSIPLATGYIEYRNNEYYFVVQIDSFYSENCLTPRQTVDCALRANGNTELSLRQDPLDFIVIAGCAKSWSQMIQELQNLLDS